MASIVTTQQSLLADGVEHVAVTPAAPDGEAFVREIRITGPDGVSMLTIRLRGATTDAIELVTPPLTF